jgi:hypothetical protein
VAATTETGGWVLGFGFGAAGKWRECLANLKHQRPAAVFVFGLSIKCSVFPCTVCLICADPGRSKRARWAASSPLRRCGASSPSCCGALKFTSG